MSPTSHHAPPRDRPCADGRVRRGGTLRALAVVCVAVLASVRRQAAGVVLAGVVALVATGCATTRLAPPAVNISAELATWSQVREQRLPMHHANLVYVGITVHDFERHATLPGWGNACDLIGKALRTWIDLPDHRSVRLIDPTTAELDRFFSDELPRMLGPEDTLILYLGTHQLKNGNILLAQGNIIDGKVLASWLNTLPQRVLLIGDVCYGPDMERRAAFQENVVRIYPSRSDEEATELFLTSKYFVTRRHFAATLAVMEEDFGRLEMRYSVMGLMFTHALRLELESVGGGTLRLDRLYQRLAREQNHFVDDVTSLKLHHPVVANLRPWILASPRVPQGAGDTPAPAGEPAAAPAEPQPPRHSRFSPLPAEPDATDTLQNTEGIPITRESQALFNQLETFLTEPKADIDLGHANLLMGKILDPSVDIAAHEARLDDIATVLRRRIGSERDPAKIIAILNAYLFGDLAFKAREEPYDRDFLLDELLETQFGRCSALSALYLALADRLDLPLEPLCLPEHVFVRWRDPKAPAADKPAVINIETTRRGVALTDAQYREGRPWEANDQADAFYMVPLTPRETVAAYLSPLSSALRQANRLEEAVLAADLAVQVLPNDAEAWNNLGMAQVRLGQRDDAAISYAKALEINPQFAEAWNNLASTEPKAIDRIPLYRKAVRYKPDLAEAWRNLAFAQYEAGQYDLAWASVVRCRRLGLDLPQAFVDDLQRRRTH